MKRLPRTYDKEFMKGAVYLAINSEKSKAQVAKELGIPITTLKGWVDKEIESKGNKEEIDEIKKLKKELLEVRMERDILKKAMAVFSRDQ